MYPAMLKELFYPSPTEVTLPSPRQWFKILISTMSDQSLQSGLYFSLPSIAATTVSLFLCGWKESSHLLLLSPTITAEPRTNTSNTKHTQKGLYSPDSLCSNFLPLMPFSVVLFSLLSGILFSAQHPHCGFVIEGNAVTEVKTSVKSCLLHLALSTLLTTWHV